jgi:hypothetical protein
MSVTITVASADIEESVWLIEINPDPAGVGDPRPPPLFMPSGTPMASLSTEGSSIATAPTIVASDRGWVQEPGDTGAVAVYPPRMLEPPAVERFIPVYPGEGRRAQVEAGELRFTNVDGALDTIAGEWAVAGRKVKLTRAPHRRPTHAPRSTWVEVASLRASEAFEGTDTLRMPLRSAAADLQVPANSLYAGTGTTEGSTGMEGVAKPRVFGFVRNMQPVLMDAANRIYQIHDGALHEIVDVRDGGLPLILKEDENSYASLVADNPSTGKYTSFKAGGFIKLHDDPIFLTVDARGNTDGGYVSTASHVAAQILRVIGGVGSAVASSFAAWPQSEVGILVREGTAEDAMNKLAVGLGSVWWGANTLGEFEGNVVSAPSVTSSTITIEPFMQIDAPEETSGSTPPWWRIRVAYQEIEVTQEGGDLVAAASTAVQEFYSRKRRFAVASDITVKTRYPLAVDGPELPGVLESKTAASTLAQSLLDIYKVPRRTWAARVGPRAGGISWWDIPIGATVTLKWPGIPTLANGKAFIVRGISARGDYADLELWG